MGEFNHFTRSDKRFEVRLDCLNCPYLIPKYKDRYLMKEVKDFRIAFGKHVDILWQKEGRVFLYLLPTILVQPPHKHYKDFAKVYISWLNFHIIIY